LLTAALLTGIAEGALAQSVEHVSSREQFGQPVGAFQAVRHRCADMAIRAEAARSLTRFASLSVDDGAPDLRFQVLSAVTIAREAALANASANIQNHGAMGFTAEHPAHLYVKRARVLSARFGGRPAQLDCLLAAPGPRFELASLS
jgi:alkylation response protein AidB-like acyl-CoA dehydrogenase